MEYVPYGAVDKIKLSADIIKAMVAVPTRSGRTCSDRDALKFMMLCQAQRLNPFAGDAFLVGYDGKDGTAKFSLITAHIALLKRAETSPDYEGMESGVILKGDDGQIIEREGDFALPEEEVVGGWARVFRKGRKPTYRRLAMSQRKPNYPSQFWEGSKAIEQIVKCSEACALRDTFPTLLGGLYHEGEIVRVNDAPGVEIPASKLVEVRSAVVEPPAEAEPEPPAEATAAAPDPSKPKTKQDELAEIITGAGYTFDQFRAWAHGSGQIDDATALAGFDQVPLNVATRLIRAKIGMLNGMAKAKEA